MRLARAGVQSSSLRDLMCAQGLSGGMDTIKIGIIGAGGNTVDQHIPGFQAIEGVEIVGICNRSHESSERLAKKCGIPTVYDNW